MSRIARKPTRKMDRRVRRTRDRLGDALVELIQEKPFDAITVQDLLDRAGVGRATFYAHFSDKNDLFISDADEFFEHMATALSRGREASQRVAPVRELFAHVAEMLRFHAALVASGRIHDLLDLAREHFACGIERRFAELPRSRSMEPAQRTAAARALAGALLSLLSWWIRDGMSMTPVQMDELFHRMVWNGVQV